MSPTVKLGIPAIALGLMAAALQACAPPPMRGADALREIGAQPRSGEQQRSTPASTSSVAMPGSPYGKIDLGVVIAPRTIGAIKTVEAARTVPLGLPSYYEDLEPTALTKALNEMLAKRFQSVTQLARAEDRASQPIDAVMVLEADVTLGTISFTSTVVDLYGTFIDPWSKELGKVEARGSGMVPWPAFHPSFTTAAKDAVEQLGKALDGQAQLASRLGRSVQTASVATPAAQMPQLALAAPGQAAAPAADGPRVALVIGNGAYATGQLRNPRNDAKLLAASLQRSGFRVTEAYDTDQKSLKRAIIEFGDQLERAGRNATGLFFYAGHGIQVDGENYLLPVEATFQREKDVPIESVNVSAVMKAMAAAGNRLNVVVLDACRNNPFARSFRSSTRGLARIDAPRGTLIAYSTSPGGVALDGDGDNSPYSLALARSIQTPSIPIEEVFKRTRVSVMSMTSDQQVPWESSSLTGNFYFMSQN